MPKGSVSTVYPCFASSIPQLDIAPVQYVSGVEEVTVDCAGVGIHCGTLPSSSITQSALPAVSAWVASNKNFFVAEAAVMLKLTELLVPPPGVGLNTVTIAVPTLAILDAGTLADICVLLINVVVSAAPFHLTTELVTKFAPFASIVKEPEPAVAVLGKMLVNEGTGLVLLMVKVRELLVPPPGKGLKTVTAAVPAAVIFAAGTDAVSWVLFT